MYDVTSIKNYILFLRNKHNLSVTLHPSGYDRIISHSELMSFNIHDNSHCIYVKTCADAQNHCVTRQCKVNKKAERGAFVGTCYAGVKEFVYPIYDRSNYIGFISVSGYSTENGLEYLHSVAEKYDLSFEKMKETYDSLTLLQKTFANTLPAVDLTWAPTLTNTQEKVCENLLTNYE